jgi:hypothetical protein
MTSTSMALTASFSPVEIRVNKFMPTEGAILNSPLTGPF